MVLLLLVLTLALLPPAATASAWPSDAELQVAGARAFSFAQGFASSGAMDWEAFRIDGVQYLALANQWDGSTNELSSPIYRHDGFSFRLHQAVESFSGTDWQHLEIDGAHYLALANHFNGWTFACPSQLLRWDRATHLFRHHQWLPSVGAMRLEHLKVELPVGAGAAAGANGTLASHNVTGTRTEHFLAVANYFDGASYEQQSPIYRWSRSVLAATNRSTAGCD